MIFPAAILPFLVLPQEVASLARTYKLGESDRYALTMTIQGTVEFSAEARLTQTVKKVWEGGDADIENRVDDLKMTVMGDPVNAPKQKPMIVRTSPDGVPVDGKENGGLVGLDLLRYVMVAPTRALKLDEKVPVATEAKSPVLGDVSLVKLENGVAELQYDLTVDVKAADRAKMRATRTVEVATGKTIRANGEITNLPQPPQGRLDAIVFTFERLR